MDKGSENLHQGSGLPKYHYKPLPTPTTIRLLQVRPLWETGESDSAVRCEVKTVGLNDDSNIDFKALSYTWGNPITVCETSCSDVMANMTPDNFRDFGFISIRPRRDRPGGLPGYAIDDGDFIDYINESPWFPRETVQWDVSAKRQIECDGQALDVSESVFGVLHHLAFISVAKDWNMECEQNRMEEEYLRKPIWIDAVCINQDDLEERKAQVLLMSRIFRSAAMVVGWLGPRDRLARLFVKATALLFDFAVKRTTEPVASLRDVPGMTTGLWFSVFALMQRLWFRRACIAQEVVFAKNVLLYTGFEDGMSTSMSWEWLTQIVAFLHETGLMRELNRLGHTLVTHQPLHGDLRRIYQDDQILDLLGSCRASGDEAYPVIQTQPEDAYAFILSVQETRERLGLSPSNSRIVIDESQGPGLQQTDLTAQGYPGGITLYGTICAVERPELGEWSSNMSEKQKMLDLARYKAVCQKNRVVVSLLSSKGKGFISDVPSPLRLIEVLSSFRSCSSTDPRDKIYAFLGIATESIGIVPDYSIPVVEAFRNVATAILTESASLELLSHIQDLADTRTNGLPSWVPDFAVPAGTLALTDHHSIMFNASGRRRKVELKIYDNTTLQVQGHKINDVARVFLVGDKHDTAARILQFGLAIPPQYPSFGSKGVSTTFEDFPIPLPLSDMFASLVAQTLPIYPDAKLYVAMGGSPVEASINVPAQGSSRDVNINELDAPDEPAWKDPTEILWQTMVAYGCRNSDVTADEHRGASPIRITGKSFSDWVLCSILDSYRLTAQVLRILSSPPQARATATDPSQHQKRVTQATKRLISERIRPKLDAWVDLSTCLPPGSSVAGAFHHSSLEANFEVTSSTDIASWFTLYVAVAAEMFRGMANQAELDYALDEVRHSLDPNLPGAMELLLWRDELDSVSAGADADSGDATASSSAGGAGDGEKSLRSIGETNKLFDEGTRRRITDFETRMMEATTGRCMLITKGGLVGLAPRSTSEAMNDEVWLLRGASVPFILRPVGDGRFLVVGEAYVYGIMRGEAAPAKVDGFVDVSLV